MNDNVSALDAQSNCDQDISGKITDADVAPLLQPLRLSSGLELSNRVVMLPMTRNRANIDGTANELMRTYYAQRASAGLIIAESTSISPHARGYFGAPGIYNKAQTQSWAAITDAVHTRGGRILLQINHYGRCSSRFMLPDGALPVAPSGVGISRKSRLVTIACPRVTPYDKPRALDTAEVEALVQDFRRATQRAFTAGFDGVEIHGDSGYLIQQFLSSNVNRRTDRYGGSIENRARFLLEVVEAAASVRSSAYVAVKLTPGWNLHEIEEEQTQELYAHIADRLNAIDPAFVHIFDATGLDSDLYSSFRQRFQGLMLAEANLTVESSAQAIAAGKADMAGFGRSFISNPDLPQRIARGTPLTKPDAETFYTPGAEGYTDYPSLEDPV